MNELESHSKLELERLRERVAKLEEALKIIALEADYDQTLSHPVDWEQVAHTLVGVARGALK